MYQQFSDQELLANIIILVKKEKDLTFAVIEHLAEIQNRRLFADLGYSSLFAYCTKHLGYCESEAYYRINAMKLTKSVPMAKALIKTGQLTIANASQVYSTLKKIEQFEKLGTLEKSDNPSVDFKQLEKKLPAQLARQLIIEVCGKSKREAEVILNGHNQSAKIKKIKIEIDNTTYQNFEKYREGNGCFSDEEIIKQLFKLLDIKKNDSDKENIIGPNIKTVKVTSVKKSRYIPTLLKLTIKNRAGNCCEYISPLSHNRCIEKRNLEFDHIQPFAKGGSSSIQNLRLLCKTHNQRMSILEFGQKKMSAFL